MNAEEVSAEIGTAIVAAFMLAGPVLAIAVVVGLLIAIVQAATQIQEQTIAQIIKIFIICLVLLLFGSALSIPLVQHATHIFNDFPEMVR